MKRSELIRTLEHMPDEELLAILEQVFAKRQPNPESRAYNRNVFYLGTAASYLESEVNEPERWSDWEHVAVAYLDRDEYPQGKGPDYGFCQFATCSCGTKLRSNVKKAICPICGAKNNLT